MSKLEYTRRRAAGFRLSEVRKDYVAGTFVERVEWDDTLDDPASGELKVHRVEVRHLAFRLDARFHDLEVKNPPRSIRTFIERLSECCGKPLNLMPMAASPVDWLSAIERVSGAATVLAIAGSGLTLSAATSASILVEGSEDVRKRLATFIQGRSVNIDRLFLRLPGSNGNQCELLSGGRAAVIHGNDETIATLRDSLRSVPRS
jgi:hypothetical protein